MSANKNSIPPAARSERRPQSAGLQWQANERESLATTPSAATPSAHRAAEPNWLAIWQRSLSAPEQDAFEKALAKAGITMSVFWEDAAPITLLSLLPFWRLDYYRAWFLGHGYADLFSYARQETIGTLRSCPEWESKLDEFCRQEFWHLSGPSALPMAEFYHTTRHGLSQLVRLISEYSQRELMPVRKPMWQALRIVVHRFMEKSA